MEGIHIDLGRTLNRSQGTVHRCRCNLIQFESNNLFPGSTHLPRMGWDRKQFRRPDKRLRNLLPG
jgi:hypothetical protein